MFYNFMAIPIFNMGDYIDTFQSTKTLVTNKVITDPVLNKAANDFIAAQTSFAKMLDNNFTTIAKHSMDSYAKLLFPKARA
jgi:hypothetical protein